MGNTLDWTERYRPKSLTQIIGNSDAIKKIRNWADSWKKGKPKKKALILIGDPGIGKTSAAHAVANDYGWDMLELNASDKRNASSIDRIVGHGSRAEGFTSTGDFYSSAEGNFKLIVFDEADNLFGREDYGGARAIVNSIRDAEQPMILIVNDYYELTRRASGVKRLATAVYFNRPSNRQVIEALTRITSEEAVDISMESLYEIAKNCEGDIRAAVNDLQSLSDLGKSEIEEIVKRLGWRDIPPQTYDALEEILGSNDILKARRATIAIDEPPDKFISWIDENLPRVIRDPDERRSALEYLARADIFLGRVRRRQYFGLWSYANDLMSMGVCLAGKGKYRIYSGTLRFPEYIMKLSRSKSRRTSMKSLMAKIAIEYHTSAEIARESIVPYLRMLFIRDREFAIWTTKRLELTPGEIGLLLAVESDSDEVDEIHNQASIENPDEISIGNESDDRKDFPNDFEQMSLFEF